MTWDRSTKKNQQTCAKLDLAVRGLPRMRSMMNASNWLVLIASGLVVAERAFNLGERIVRVARKRRKNRPK